MHTAPAHAHAHRIPPFGRTEAPLDDLNHPFDADLDALADLEAADAVVDLPSPPTLLRRGATGALVFRLQRALNLHDNAVNFPPPNGPIHHADLLEDGIFGPLTEQELVRFQQRKSLPLTRVADPATWAALEARPIADRPPLNRARLGAFLDFVPLFVDEPFAALLRRMEGPPSAPAAFPWNRDTARFAFQTLRSGALVGIVFASNYCKLVRRVHQTVQPRLSSQAQVNAVGLGTVRFADLHGARRGIVVFNDQALGWPPNAAQAAFKVRDQIDQRKGLAHELCHFRNRDRTDFGVPPPGSGLPANDFVDPARAAAMNGSASRSGLIDELGTRHVAWHVEEELRLGAGRPVTTTPPPLQFFQAALGIALSFGVYGDQGYMRSLAATNPAGFRRQVGLWIRKLAVYRFHSDPTVEAAIRAYFTGVAGAVAAAGFTVPAGTPGSGLA